MARKRKTPYSRVSALREQLDKTLEVLPGGVLVKQGLETAEDQIIKGLKKRLEQVDLPALPAPGRSLQNPEQMADVLLAKALDQNLDEAKGYLFERILGQLVPDEMRIIAALSGGNGHALIHVAAGPPVGPVIRRMHNNVSLVGKVASVVWLDQVPMYITNLRNLGVVHTLPEDKELEVKYQVLQGDTEVRRIAKHIEKEFRMPARYLRRVLHLSPLGEELWAACRPSEAGNR